MKVGFFILESAYKKCGHSVKGWPLEKEHFMQTAMFAQGTTGVHNAPVNNYRDLREHDSQWVSILSILPPPPMSTSKLS